MKKQKPAIWSSLLGRVRLITAATDRCTIHGPKIVVCFAAPFTREKSTMLFHFFFSFFLPPWIFMNFSFYGLGRCEGTWDFLPVDVSREFSSDRDEMRAFRYLINKT